MKGFRCPNCGQAHEMKVNDITVRMNEEMTELTFHVKDEVFNKLEEIEEAKVEGFSIVNKGECTKCKDQSSVNTWMKAFEDPLMFFEMEELCHCGGELWMDQIPGTQSYAFVCDDCGWVKPQKKVSGA